jgi:hypothetical protein
VQKCECTNSISGCAQAKAALITESWTIPKEDEHTAQKDLLLTNNKYVIGMWEEGKCIDGKPEAKCPLGKPWRRWKENIKIYLLKSRICCVNCIYLAQRRGKEPCLMNTVRDRRVPKNEGNFFTN